MRMAKLWKMVCPDESLTLMTTITLGSSVRVGAYHETWPSFVTTMPFGPDCSSNLTPPFFDSIDILYVYRAPNPMLDGGLESTKR